MLSTRPPPTLGASLENKKRIRSGSISLSLQHVSELLEEGVLENREQKGVVKDLIISGNEEILEMIHQYNQNGDKKPIQRLVRSYSFNRKSSLDLLGDDLTLEFAELLFPKPQPPQQDEEEVLGSEEHDAADLATSQQQRRQDFRDDDDDEYEAYDVMLLGNEDQEDLHSILRTPPFRPVAFTGKQTSSLQQQQQQQQQRMRSCSLSSTSFFHSLPPAREESMLNMLLEGDDENEAIVDDELMPSRSNVVSFFGSMEPAAAPTTTAEVAGKTATTGGEEVDLLDDVEEIEDIDEEYNDDEEEMRPPPTPMKKTKNQTKPMQIPKPTKSSSAGAIGAAPPLKKRNPVPYSPPVSSPSPPDSTSHIPALPTEEDIAYKRSLGIVMTGAYSPDSRATRVGRFVDKRDQRVWKKKVKYDVRKNFADSRLRVKGRFVKKEDEEVLREFMCFV